MNKDGSTLNSTLFVNGTLYSSSLEDSEDPSNSTFGADAFTFNVSSDHFVFGLSALQPDPDLLRLCMELLPDGRIEGVHCFWQRDTLCVAKERCTRERSCKMCSRYTVRYVP